MFYPLSETENHILLHLLECEEPKSPPHTHNGQEAERQDKVVLQNHAQGPISSNRAPPSTGSTSCH